MHGEGVHTRAGKQGDGDCRCTLHRVARHPDRGDEPLGREFRARCSLWRAEQPSGERWGRQVGHAPAASRVSIGKAFEPFDEAGGDALRAAECVDGMSRGARSSDEQHGARNCEDRHNPCQACGSSARESFQWKLPRPCQSGSSLSAPPPPILSCARGLCAGVAECRLIKGCVAELDRSHREMTSRRSRRALLHGPLALLATDNDTLKELSSKCGHDLLLFVLRIPN